MTSVQDVWLEAIDQHDLQKMEELLLAVEDRSSLNGLGLVEAAFDEQCFAAVRLMLKAGIDCKTLLHRAALLMEIDDFLFCLPFQKDLDERDRNGCCVLHLLANRHVFLERLGSSLAAFLKEIEEQSNDDLVLKRLDMISSLLNAGADRNARIMPPALALSGMYLGASALDVSRYTKSTVIETELLKQKATSGKIRDPQLLFYHLSQRSDEADQLFLLLASALIKLKNIRNLYGETIFHVACRFGRIQIVRWLLVQGFDVEDNGTEDENTPIFSAIYALGHRYKGAYEVLAALLQEGADPNVLNSSGMNPVSLCLLLCSKLDNFEQLLLLLFSFGASARITSSGIEPVFLLAAQGNIDWRLFALLRKHGADFNSVQKGKTLLHILAAKKLSLGESFVNEQEIIRNLINEGCDVNALATEESKEDGRIVVVGSSVLDLALLSENYETFDFLRSLNARFALVEQDSDNFDPLFHVSMLASQERYTEALNAIEEFLEEEPDELHAWLLKASLFFELDEYNECLVCFEKALSLSQEPLNSELYVIQGAAYYFKKEYELALKAFQQVPVEDIELQNEIHAMVEYSLLASNPSVELS